MAMSFEYFSPAEAEQYAFYRIPKMLISDDRFRCISTEAKLLYGILLDRVSLSLKNGWVDEQNHVYIICTIEQVMADMNCSNKKAIAILKKLETKVPLIEKKRQGLGKPNLIYVKNFFCQCKDEEEFEEDVDNSPSRMKKGNVSGCKNDTSVGDNSTFTDMTKVHGNNTNNNNTEISNTNPILSGQMGSDEMESEYLKYKIYFHEKLGIDALISMYPYEKDTILGLWDLITDTCSSRKKVIYIAGEAKSSSIVKSRFMKLDMSHLQYVMKCLNENSTRINNIRQYILTTLYNAPSTIGPFYRAWVNNDMATGQLGGNYE
ncbi:MAG: DUF6017 domain-containing protein [Lachnospiraceae bacterium]|nr:DUF6017 domain-containing protein [Lachnospiraceae bacterium]